MIVLATITLAVNVREHWLMADRGTDLFEDVHEFLQNVAKGLPVSLEQKPEVARACHVSTRVHPITGEYAMDFETQHQREELFFAPDGRMATAPAGCSCRETEEDSCSDVEQ